MAETYVEVETDESKTPTLAERLKSVIGTAIQCSRRSAAPLNCRACMGSTATGGGVDH